MRTVLLQLISVIILAGCSIKEDRSDCPCTVLIDFSGLDPVESPSVGLAAFTEDRAVLEDTVFAEEYQELYSFRIRRVSSLLNIFSGWTEKIPPEDGFVVEEGEQFPPLYLQTVVPDTDSESVSVKADVHKAYCTVTINVKSAGKYSYSLSVRGDCTGYTREGSTVSGAFLCSLSPDDEGLCSVRIPRQYDSSLTLCVLEDQNTLREFAIGEYIVQSGYDWQSEDLEDIEIEIDYARTEVSFKVNEWETTVSFDVII